MYGVLLGQWTWNPSIPQLLSVACSGTIPNGKEMFTPPLSVAEQSSRPCRSAAVGAAIASITGGTEHAHAIQTEETRESHDKNRATAMGASQVVKVIQNRW
jgi:hypothetical protein